MTKLRPLSNNLIVKRHEAKTTSDGGLFIPDSSQTKPHRGTVLAVGPGYHTDAGVLITPDCRVGDVVMFAQGVGVEIEHDGQKCLTVSEDAVIAIVEVE